MHISERIRSLRLEHQMSQEELAKVVGVHFSTISSWEQGKAIPRMGAIQRMADLFNVKKSFIIGDDYEPLPQENKKLSPINDKQFGQEKVVEIEIRGYAFAGYNNSEVDYVPNGKLYVPARNKGAFAVKVVGDSMEPQLFSSDYAICREYNSFANPTKKDIMLVYLEGEPLFKCLDCRPDGVRVISLNQEYPELFLSPDLVNEKLTIIAKAVGVYREY